MWPILYVSLGLAVQTFAIAKPKMRKPPATHWGLRRQSHRTVEVTMWTLLYMSFGLVVKTSLIPKPSNVKAPSAGWGLLTWPHLSRRDGGMGADSLHRAQLDAQDLADTEAQKCASPQCGLGAPQPITSR